MTAKLFKITDMPEPGIDLHLTGYVDLPQLTSLRGQVGAEIEVIKGLNEKNPSIPGKQPIQLHTFLDCMDGAVKLDDEVIEKAVPNFSALGIMVIATGRNAIVNMFAGKLDEQAGGTGRIFIAPDRKLGLAGLKALVEAKCKEGSTDKDIMQAAHQHNLIPLPRNRAPEIKSKSIKVDASPLLDEFNKNRKK
jgi:hypothetical protein